MDKDTGNLLRDILRRLTLDEKIALCHGDGAMSTHGVPRLNLPPTTMNDGPQGVRLEDGRTATALPCGIALASTFDTAAAREYGALLGRETLGTGTQSILGPGVNLMRSPLGARNFEYFGEDPVLAGEIAAAYISGCQGEGAGTAAKHFALNNQETCRLTGSSNIDERTLRELYLRAFEILVKKSRPWMVMCSYNRINGVFASENRHLLTEILKEEWGYDGVVVSDWGAIRGDCRPALNGMDLDMGGGDGAWFNRPLKEAVRLGKVPEKVLDGMVLRILRLMYRTGCFDTGKRPSGEVNTARNRRQAKKLAQQGMVLLKNDGMLPLCRKKIRRIAVIGPAADFRHHAELLIMGGGSGAVHPEYEITPLAGLREYLGEDVIIDYAPGVRYRHDGVLPSSMLRTADGRPGLTGEYYESAEALRSGGKPLLVRTDAEINFIWGWNNGNVLCRDNPTVLDNAETMAVRWSGFIVPERSESAEISFFGELFVRFSVKINGEPVISSEGEKSYRIQAEAGKPVAVEIIFERCCRNINCARLLYRGDTGAGQALEAAARADAVLFFGGSNHSRDREYISSPDPHNTAYGDIPDYGMPDGQAEFIGRLLEINPDTAVILYGGAPVSVEPWCDRVRALLMCWYPGMENGRAAAEVLFGDAEPEGRLCCTWGKELDDYACHALKLFPGHTQPMFAYTDYLEGLYIGYRWFDRRGVTPRFPFGFGLGYTEFRQKVKKVECSGRSVTAEVAVTNTGVRSGAQVIQLYVRDRQSSVDRPDKELQAFAKIRLNAGETGTAVLRLEERDFMFYSEKNSGFIFEPGEFELLFGTSAADIFDTVSVTLN